MAGGKGSIQSSSSSQPCYGSTVDDGLDLERADGLSGVVAGASLFGKSSSCDAFSFQNEGTYGGLAAYEDTSSVWFGKHVNRFSEKAPSELGCSGWPHNGRQLAYEENVAPQYDNFGSSCLVTNASSSEIPYTYFPESISVGIPVWSSNPKSSDNECAMQHDSCLVTPIGFYSSTTNPTQTLNIQLSPRTYSPADKSTSTYESSRFHHEDMDTASKNLPANARDPSIQVTIESKEGYCDRGRVNSHTDKCKDSYSLKNGFPLAGELGTGNLMDPFRINELSFSKSAHSESNPSTSNVFVQVPSETVDQDSLAEDSPCWKGVSAPKHTLPSMKSISFPNVVMESKSCRNLDQAQTHLPFPLSCPATLDEDGRRVYDANGQDSSFLREPIAIGLPKTQPKSVLMNRMSDDVENQNRMRILNSESFKEQIREISKACERDSQSKDDGQLCLEAGVLASNHARIEDETIKLKGCVNTAVQDHSSDPHIYDKETFMNFPGEVVKPLGSCSVSEKCSQSGGVQLVIKAMHNLSRVLLSTNFPSCNDMRENDFELLQGVINNLEAFSRNKGKAAEIPIAMVDDGSASDGRSMHALKMEMQSVNPILNSDKSVDCAARRSDKNFMNQGKVISQAFERVLDKPPSHLKRSPPWLLYKNLWIEAEATLCLMKCELQAARMEIELNNQKHQTQANTHDRSESLPVPSQVMKPVMPTSMNDAPPLTGDDDAVKSKCSESHEPLIRNTNEGGNVDASVMARLSLLKDRMEKTNSSCSEEHGTKETMKSPLSSSTRHNTGLESLQAKVNGFNVFDEMSGATSLAMSTTITSLTTFDRPVVRISMPKAKKKQQIPSSNNVSQPGSWNNNQTELLNLL